MARIFDIIAILAVAVVVFLPEPSIRARPALEGDPIELDRVAEQQDDLYRTPTSIDAALRLADSFLSFSRSDWAIATLAGFRNRKDPRVHLMLATAYAERLQAAQAVKESEQVERLCTTAKPACPPAMTIKGKLLKEAMAALADQRIDPAKDPMRAKQAVYQVLHPAKYQMKGP